MLKRPKADDIREVVRELVAELKKDPYAFNDWEKGFLKTMKDDVLLFGIPESLTNKQLRSLYKMYYERVEHDSDAFDEWVEAHGFGHV
jgi:hypothetical protein